MALNEAPVPPERDEYAEAQRTWKLIGRLVAHHNEHPGESVTLSAADAEDLLELISGEWGSPAGYKTREDREWEAEQREPRP
jgi:hypothetical protein